MDSIFLELGIITIVATVGGLFSKLFKQPLIPTYIIIGVILGPILGFVQNQEVIATFSEMGLVFLLFMVGLEIDFKRLRDVGNVSLFGGAVQTLLLFLLGVGLAWLIGFDAVPSMYIGMVLALSSTMVVIKMLSDKKELETLHGRIILGVLLVQDFFAIVFMTFITLDGNTSILTSLLSMLVKGGILILGLLFSVKFVLPRLFKFAAKTTEMLLLSSLSMCFLLAIVFHYAGLSAAIGAFIAGLVLGNLPYNLEIAGRARSLRDYFSTLFFVSLGLQVAFWDLPNLVLPIVVFSIFIIFFKPFIIAVICQIFGYMRKTAFMTGICLGQISEFSLIIISVGVSLGTISNRIMTLTVLLAVVTITITSYFIKFDREMYDRFARPLKRFKKFEKKKDQFEYIPDNNEQHMDIILAGYNRVGYSIFNKLKDLRREFLVVDFNPETIKRLIMQRVPCIYGDIGDLEILERLDLRKVRMIISTIADDKTNKLLVKKTKEVNKTALIFVTAHHIDDALELYEAGADYVILPHFLGGDHFSLILEDVTLDITKLIKKKIEHIQELHVRRSHGHHHPPVDHHVHRKKKHSG